MPCGRIAQEEMHLSPKMAVRLGRYFGNGPEFWAALQTQFDLALAARELAGDLRKIAPRRTLKFKKSFHFSSDPRKKSPSGRPVFPELGKALLPFTAQIMPRD